MMYNHNVLRNFYLIDDLKEKKKEKKRRMTECKNIKKRTISSCMDLVGDHGAQQRDEWKGFVGEEEKWRRGRRRREKEGEET